jgi:hypothetical protein
MTFGLLVAACGGNQPTSNNNSNSTDNAKANGNNPLSVTTPTPEAITNNAPTLTPVFKAYCDAWVKSDEAGLRKVYSSDTIKQFEQDMKEEKQKSLIKFLEPTDRVSGTPCEVKNEQINGDNATAKIFSDKYPNGIAVVFVKQNGEWKLTNRSPALESVKSSNTASNSAK